MALIDEARAFVAQHGADIDYVQEWDQWIRYDGVRWRGDRHGDVEYQAQVFLGDPGPARVGAFLELVKRLPGVSIAPEQLDANPLELNCLNGTLDLPSGELRDHRREDHLTRMAPVEWDPKATAPTWQAFVDRAAGGDPEVKATLQAVAGYLISGVTSAQVLLTFTGNRQAGQLFLDTLSALLGEYSVTMPQRVFLSTYRDDLVCYFPRLRAARLVTITDSHDGSLLSLLDGTTPGSKSIGAQASQMAFYPFRPAFTLALLCSFTPHGRSLQNFTNNRAVLFNRVLPVSLAPVENLEGLRNSFLDQLPGILSWAVRGHGKALPKAAFWQSHEVVYRSERAVKYEAEAARAAESNLLRTLR